MNSSSICTIRDVAEESGVSASTVSLVMNNHPRISPATVLKVREAAKKIGYEPGNINSRKGHRSKPRRPSSYRKMQVALISQVKPMLLETPVYSKVLRGIEDELGKINYNFIIRNLPEENPEQAIPHKIDGAILFAMSSIRPRPLLKKLREIPGVGIMGAPGDFFDLVTYNNRNIGKIAAEHLLAKGHKALLYMGRENDCGDCEYHRHHSFMDSVEKSGAKAYEMLSDYYLDEFGRMQLPNVKAIGSAIEKMKQLQVRPTAIFASMDIYVIGLYHTLRHHDIIPGKDVEIVGVNNDSIFLNHFSPRPASVDIHPEEMGRKAVERLLWRIDNPKEMLGKIEIEPEMAFE